MLQRALGLIAGVDRKTLASCPATDKMWATHLGFSLCLSFVVVLGVSFHATGYMIVGVGTRLLVSVVIALTVLMFDRALCQSDWFYQGTLWNNATKQTGAEARQSAWRFVRIAVRLSMSFGLAWVIAMFLELAIFSGTINEKIEADRVAANAPIYQKIQQYQSQLDAESDRRQANIAALEQLHRDAVTSDAAAEPSTLTRSDEIEQQIKALGAREAAIRDDIRDIDGTIQRYVGDMHAEEFGLKVRPGNSGRPGAGMRYEYAKKQKESFEAQRAAREAEIAQLHAKRDELRGAQAQIAAQALASRDRERDVIQRKRDALQAQIDAARADLRQFDATKAASVAEFRSKALSESYYQEKKDRVDPLTRMAAYQELKNDPKDGATMALFSWMTRFFIIFLEIVPVVAKIFFSPPSVYAAKIQAQVERARQRIEANEDVEDQRVEPVIEPAAARPAPSIATIHTPAIAMEAFDMPRRRGFDRWWAEFADQNPAPVARPESRPEPLRDDPVLAARQSEPLRWAQAEATPSFAVTAAPVGSFRPESSLGPATSLEPAAIPADLGYDPIILPHRSDAAQSSVAALPAEQPDPTVDAQLDADDAARTVQPPLLAIVESLEMAEPPAPPAADQPEQISSAQVVKFSADVENLMSEAMERSKAAKAGKRRKHGAFHTTEHAEHLDGDGGQLPLNYSLQYEIFPRA
ncbi:MULTISPECIES: DUF4407 domain-containing protein [Rhodopseudomonas]|uniref:DUF4407 domain-containing protein n=1 Tax=Rhodopseudomonas palustris TaxID=1076 RepID=A0A0D7EKW5_RHOPL|nr:MULTISPECIES: DUF4407 domain-containing protein [Rhodopseudomonas]KIZ41479.1 hypothetical protein OO17_14975 [Rhodopseudomonas palustris]MDF3813815.1 DUF4407 domain-containing protein [Rhodopseudomonas sp. BAL398]WOK19423.1 DUF4407 domain-containing protein [Rhodopseudomonas sp. BAL398]